MCAHFLYISSILTLLLRAFFFGSFYNPLDSFYLVKKQQRHKQQHNMSDWDTQTVLRKSKPGGGGKGAVRNAQRSGGGVETSKK